MKITLEKLKSLFKRLKKSTRCWKLPQLPIREHKVVAVSRRPSNSKIIKRSRDPYATPDDGSKICWGRRGSYRGLNGVMRGGSISRRIQESRKNENLARLANKGGTS